jgi:hypothetical protein
MGHLLSDNITTSKSGPDTGLESDRAAQVARENQSGVNLVRLAGLTSAYSWAMPGLGLEGIVVPDLVPAPPEANQISDCRKDKCIVNGKQYANSTDIPGNHPKPLLHPDGKPVLDPEGKPVVGPDGVDLEKIANDARANRNLLTMPFAVFKFRHSGEWDFQRRMTDDIPGAGVRPIFTKQYQNFSNIGVGYILGSLGASLHDIGSYSNTYCWARRCNYSEPRAKEFPNIAERQLKDYEIGIRLWNERHPQAKP